MCAPATGNDCRRMGARDDQPQTVSRAYRERRPGGRLEIEVNVHKYKATHCRVASTRNVSTASLHRMRSDVTRSLCRQIKAFVKWSVRHKNIIRTFQDISFFQRKQLWLVKLFVSVTHCFDKFQRPEMRWSTACVLSWLQTHHEVMEAACNYIRSLQQQNHELLLGKKDEVSGMFIIMCTASYSYNAVACFLPPTVIRLKTYVIRLQCPVSPSVMFVSRDKTTTLTWRNLIPWESTSIQLWTIWSACTTVDVAFTPNFWGKHSPPENRVRPTTFLN